MSDESAPVRLVAKADAVIACTLEPSDLSRRLAEWRSLLDRVSERRRTGGGIHLTFEPRVRAAEVAALAEAEHGCCGFFSFAVTVDGRGVGLEVQAPTEAEALLQAFFGASD